MSTSLPELLPPPTRPLPKSPSASEPSSTSGVNVPVPPRGRWSSASDKDSRRASAGFPIVNTCGPSLPSKDEKRIVHASYDALVEKSFGKGELERPSLREADETTQRTRAALEKRLERKIAVSKPNNIRGSGRKRQASYVRYTPANASRSHNSGASQRIIKMMAAPVDPMEPSRFRQKKAPPNPPSPPTAVLHSPNRKVSKEELEDWKIPPCVSNWKNNHGYTIPLDKRLAADGRGLQDNRINDRFASLAESLYIAEKTARAEVEARAKVQRERALKEKEAQEMKLRELATKARQERTGMISHTDSFSRRMPEASDVRVWRGVGALSPSRLQTEKNRSPDTSGRTASSLDEEKEEAVRSRDAIRKERRRERDRELRKRQIHDDNDNIGPTLKRSKLTRDRDRDISERVALGQRIGTEGARGEVMYDQRLFNQTQGGLSAGFGPDDAYNIYDKPLFRSSGDKFQYSQAMGTDTGDKNTLKFRPSQNFKGLDDTSASRSHGPRSQLVEFEREDGPEDLTSRARHGPDHDDKESDPFGLNKFLNAAKQGRSESQS